VEDSGGVIKVAGIGTYNSTGNTITRNDTWNYNGTVVDKNPATNITLSGGTHTVRCDATAATISMTPKDNKTSTTANYNGIINSSAGVGKTSLHADTQYAYVFQLMDNVFASTLQLNVNTLDAAGLASVGLTKCIDGIPDTSYIASGSVDITTTGSRTIPVNTYLEAGWYFCHLVTTSATAQFNSTGKPYNGSAVGWTPLQKTLYNNRSTPCMHLSKATVTLGTLDPNPETVTSNATSTTNEVPLIFILNG